MSRSVSTVAVAVALVSAAFLVRSPLLAQAPRPDDVQFKAAQHKEEVEGDLKGAIEEYAKLAQSRERAIAARALVRMADCYQKLGDPQARTIYERVVREFADQKEAAGDARTRLAALADPGRQRATGPTARRVWGGRTGDSVSADGRFLSFTDWETGDVAIRDLRAGMNHRLTAKGSWTESPEFAEFTVISPDGNQVVYGWSNKAGFYELRLVDRRGGAPRVLYRNEDVRVLEPFDWSPDGKQIVAVLRRLDRTNQLVLVRAADGAVSVLKTLDWRIPWQMAFSPDGRYVVYDFPSIEDAPERDVFLLALDGSREVPLVTHPAHDFLLGWFPRSNHVVFASNRTGTNSAWAVRVENGRPQGEAELLKPGIGLVWPMNFTRSGDYFYGLGTGIRAVKTGRLDPSTGRLLDSLAPLEGRFDEGKLGAVWSPDGDRIAYLVQSSLVRGGEGANTLAIQVLETGQVHSIPLKMSYASAVRWMPDGRALIVRGTEIRGRTGLFRVRLDGRFEPVVYGSVARFAIAPDATRLFYGRHDPQQDAIVSRDLQTGEERDVSYGSSGFALSPDGQWLAVKVNLRRPDGGLSPFPSVQIVRASGGEARTIATLEERDSSDWREMAWSADGRYVFFTLRGDELWQIAAAGGTPRRLAANLAYINAISVHPDGRRLAVSAGAANYETWVMENLLPNVRASR